MSQLKSENISFPINTLLLAAGKSSRIMNFSKGLPKPLLLIAGEAIIFRNLRWLYSAPIIHSVWINLHYQHELMLREIKNFSSQIPHAQLQFFYEKNILGTAGALANILLHAHVVRNAPVLVVYGDNLLNFDLCDFITTHITKKNDVTIALFDERQHIHTGIAGGKVLLDDHFIITEFLEGRKYSSSHYVNAGVYLLSSEIASRIPSDQFCDFGKDFFPKLLMGNLPLNGYIIKGYCLGLDTPECFKVALELIDQKKVALL